MKNAFDLSQIDQAMTAMTAVKDAKAGAVCHLRGDVHVLPFAGSKFSEPSEGLHPAFVVDNLQGLDPFQIGDLSLSPGFEFFSSKI